MTETRTLAVMVLIETDDPDLFPEQLLRRTLTTSGIPDAMRRSARAQLLTDPGEILMVSTPEVARMITRAHEAVMARAGQFPPRDKSA